MSKTWNVWDVKNRWLRAIVAWLLVGVAALVVLITLPFAIVWLAVAGVIGGFRATWLDHQWRELAKWFWAAATGKGEPR